MKVNKRCLCFELKCGLYVWGFFSLALIYMTYLFMLYHLQNIFNGDDTYFSSVGFVFLCIAFFGNILHMIFNITLVAGLWTKNTFILKIYNKYLVISMLLEAIMGALFIPLSFFRLEDTVSSLTVYLYFGAAICVIIDIMFKYYIVISVRSYISSLLGYDHETESVYNILIVDNFKRRKNDYNLNPIEDIDVSGRDKFAYSKDDKLESKENSGIVLLTKNSKEDIDVKVDEVAVIVHDSTSNSENESKINESPAREDTNIILDDNKT